MSLVFQFAKSLLTQKLRDRFRTYANFDKLTENVPISILPAEAGGQVPMAVMIDQWKAVLEERQESILSLDRVEYGIENSIPSSQNSNPDSTLPTSETSEPAVTSKTSTTSKNDLKKKKASTTSKKQKSQSTTSSEVIDVMSSVCKIEMSTWSKVLTKISLETLVYKNVICLLSLFFCEKYRVIEILSVKKFCCECSSSIFSSMCCLLRCISTLQLSCCHQAVVAHLSDSH